MTKTITIEDTIKRIAIKANEKSRLKEYKANKLISKTLTLINAFNEKYKDYAKEIIALAEALRDNGFDYGKSEYYRNANGGKSRFFNGINSLSLKETENGFCLFVSNAACGTAGETISLCASSNNGNISYGFCENSRGFIEGELKNLFENPKCLVGKRGVSTYEDAVNCIERFGKLIVIVFDNLEKLHDSYHAFAESQLQ